MSTKTLMLGWIMIALIAIPLYAQPLETPIANNTDMSSNFGTQAPVTTSQVFLTGSAGMQSAGTMFQQTKRFPKGRIFLRSGQMLEVKNIVMSTDSVSAGSMTYPLSDVQQIMVKKGSANKWAQACGGGCAALAGLAFVVSADDPSMEGQEAAYFASAAMWVAIFTVGGYAIGYITDDWQPIYFAPRSARNPQPFNLCLASDRSTRQLTLRYRF